MKNKSYIITSALPYANGPLHIGHILEAIQTDIWARAKKLDNKECLYLCADDAHGTAIMLSSKKNNQSPEEYVSNIKIDHEKDFKNFGINFDCYHSTHSAENIDLVNEVWSKIKPYTYSEETAGLYDTKEEMFLPDRFVKGECPKCGAKEQSGDNCEKCSFTYSASELINPISVISGTRPDTKQTKVIYLDINKVKTKTKEWIEKANINNAVKNKLLEWFDKDLRSWAISRDLPYFGIKIPSEENKYFYVWADAPLGYIASLIKYFNDKKMALDKWNTSEIFHVIGKDIVNFHGVFWPAMLIMAELKLPENIITHGFLNINNQKMSKSKNIMIKASEFSKYGDYEFFRYFVASRTNNNIEDIDFNAEDFRLKVNSSLVGKYINISSRISSIIEKNFQGNTTEITKSVFLSDLEKNIVDIIKNYHSFNYANIIKFFEDTLDKVNIMISNIKPWALVKTNPEQAQIFCTEILNSFYKISILIKPILPSLVEKIENLFGLGKLNFTHIEKIWSNQNIKYKILLTRIPEYKEEMMSERLAVENQEQKIEQKIEQVKNDVSSIDIKDLQKISLKIAKIINAAEVEGADKLLQLTVDWNEGPKNVFAGIKSSYGPDDLIGKMTVVVTNLKPRKMRFGISEAMVLIANDENGLYLLEPDTNAKPGNKVS